MFRNIVFSVIGYQHSKLISGNILNKSYILLPFIVTKQGLWIAKDGDYKRDLSRNINVIRCQMPDL